MHAATATASVLLGDIDARLATVQRTTRLLARAPYLVIRVNFVLPIVARRAYKELSRKIAKSHLRVLELRAALSGSFKEPQVIDIDGSLCDQLANIRREILEMHRAIDKNVARYRSLNLFRASEPLVNAMERAVHVARELYDSIGDLQEDIEEHDADLLPRGNGLVATSQQDLDEVLKRLLSA